MLTTQQYFELFGLTTLALGRRQELDAIQNAICKFLKSHGIEDAVASDWAGELVFNEGDDPEAVVNRVLDILNLKVQTDA